MKSSHVIACTIDRPRPGAQGALMRLLVRFLAAACLLWPCLAEAQVQPHRAEYALRLGAAVNAPRIGTAVQDLSLDCTGWHLQRDITTEIALTTSWKLNVASKLDAEEQRGGDALRYRILQNQNGNERETRGRVQRVGRELRAEIVSPNSPPAQFLLPAPTLMPVAAIDHMIERLRAGIDAFPALAFDAEVIGDAFLVDVSQLDSGAVRGTRPADRLVAVPGTSWPVFMTFTRGRDQQQKPLFTVSTQVFETGVLDHLTVETGLVSITADLQSLEMRKAPVCPRS
jgi:hypothetical protein